MGTAWEVLIEAGVPDGAARIPATARLDAASVVDALSSFADADRLRSHERECLGAWLAAFRHHWPDRFRVMLGPLGDRVLDQCTTADLDANRYLKLRRIATANLARRL